MPDCPETYCILQDRPETDCTFPLLARSCWVIVVKLILRRGTDRSSKKGCGIKPDMKLKLNTWQPEKQQVAQIASKHMCFRFLNLHLVLFKFLLLISFILEEGFGATERQAALWTFIYISVICYLIRKIIISREDVETIGESKESSSLFPCL